MNRLLKLETLDTSFVNLGALIRHLRQRQFVGRVKVELEEYEVDVFLDGAGEPSIWEKNHATGRGAQGKDAMDRLLVRARDAGGLITIYEGPGETGGVDEHSVVSTETRGIPDGPEVSTPAEPPATPVDSPLETGETDWDELLMASGELIASVERAAASVNEDFAGCFQSALVALGDDYPFLDPTAGGFQYANGKIQMSIQPFASDFVLSLTESLRRVVSRLSDGKAGQRFRERVAVELVVVARRKENAFAEFTPHLDRIAGTQVL
jgi:hypothetical protein